MNDLVKRLSEKKGPVQVNRPDTDVESLLERIRLKFLHVLFTETGTEIGIQLDEKKCNLSKADFVTGSGTVHCEGVLTLNYDKVRCIVDFDLSTMDGTGRLVLEDEESSYSAVLTSREKIEISR